MQRGFRISVITKNGTNPAYDGARIGASRVAERLGGSVRHAYPQVPDDVPQQRALIEAALAERPDAIVLAPVHPAALDATLSRVVEAGIPLVYMVSSSPAVLARSFVTADNHALALAVARHLIAHLGGRGNLALMEGHPDSPTSAPRTEGFLAAAAEHTGIRIVAQVRGDYQRDAARKTMAGILERVPTIEGVLAANDYMALGVLEALDAADRRAPLVGVNAMPDAIRAIRAGRLLATAAYDAMQMACIATEAATRLLSGQPVPGQIVLPAEIVDAANCAAWDLPYEQRPLPDWDAVVGAG
ncbi:MAG TPA: sugar ABC transporter substrate-binding protein [bacterium]|nr:sugar ABC transporter substrate-binding protein [bacterium]